MDKSEAPVYFSDMRADEWPVRLNRAGRHRCAAGWLLNGTQTRRWTDLDLWLLVSGQGWVETPEGTRELGPGSCLLMRGGEDYAFQRSRRQPFVHCWAHFDYVSPAGEALDYRKLELPPRLRRLDNLRLVEDLFDRIIEAQRDPSPASGSRANQWFAAILMEVAAHDAAALGQTEDRPHHPALQAMRNRILADPGGEHRIDVMADELGVTASYFCRMFADRFGQSPRQYVTTVRMDTARYLLRDTVLPISHIATMLGYGDVHFFSRHFRRQQGVSPTAYRHGEAEGSGQ